MKEKKVTLKAKMRAALLEMGDDARITGAQLCKLYVELGGKNCNPERRDKGHGSTMYRMQYDLPIVLERDKGSFSVKNVYRVSLTREAELVMDDAS